MIRHSSPTRLAASLAAALVTTLLAAGQLHLAAYYCEQAKSSQALARSTPATAQAAAPAASQPQS